MVEMNIWKTLIQMKASADKELQYLFVIEILAERLGNDKL